MSTLTKRSPHSPLRRPLKKAALPPRRVRESVPFPGFTIKDWAAMPDAKPRYELIDGKLIQKMTTKRKHSRAAGEFLFACKEWAKSTGWQFDPEGTGVFVTETKGYVPDVVGFLPGAELDPEESVGAAPFLVVEVLSHGTRKKDREEKTEDYARIGVELYVLIDPDKRTVEVFRPDESGQKYGAPELLGENETWKPAELPGLKLDLKNLWMD